MPISYRCDRCDATADTLSGWWLVEVATYSTADVPAPGSRVLAGTPTTLYFHAPACRDAWLGAAGLAAGTPDNA